jgi:serine/threonine-protein kinase
MHNPGDVLDGKYRIVRQIGEGGMGTVFEGEAIRLHRRVAIKVLRAGAANEQSIVARFELEAQAAGRVGSQHIVEILDLGVLPTEERYMVMEYLDGESLGTRIRRGRMTPTEVHHVAAQLLEALGAAHNAGIIHRDIKPENVYLLRKHAGITGFVKLLDFGISKFGASGNKTEMSMTQTGTVLGTPFYMSPEQARGAKQLDHRADLYAVGVLLYECLTGRVPFSADSFNELVFKIVLEVPEPIAAVAPGVDPGFTTIVSRAMAREPDQRFQTAQEFQEALSAWATGASIERLAGPSGAATVRVDAAQTGQPFAAPSSFAEPGRLADSGRMSNTAESWSKPGRRTGVVPGVRRGFPVIPAVAIGIVAAALAAAFFVFRSSSATPVGAVETPVEAAAAAAAPAPAAVAPVPEPRIEPAEAPAAEQAEPVIAVAPEAQPSAEPERPKAPPQPASRQPVRQSAKPAVRSTQVASKPQPPTATTKPPEGTPAAAKPSGDDGSTTSAGRPIRSSL